MVAHCRFESYPDYRMALYQALDMDRRQRLQIWVEIKNTFGYIYIGVEALRIVGRHSLCVLWILKTHIYNQMAELVDATHLIGKAELKTVVLVRILFWLLRTCSSVG